MFLNLKFNKYWFIVSLIIIFNIFIFVTLSSFLGKVVYERNLVRDFEIYYVE